MRRIGALLVVSAVLVGQASALPAGRTAQYRSGKAASGVINFSGSQAAARGGSGAYLVVLFEPVPSLTGFAAGAGTISSPAVAGMLDVDKPWVLVTRFEGTTGIAGRVRCQSIANVTKVNDVDAHVLGTYILADTPSLSGASVRTSCGTDQIQALWLRPGTPQQQFAWSYPIRGGGADPTGAITMHGLDFDAYYTVCDAVGCLPATIQSFWRIYDANLTLGRNA